MNLKKEKGSKRQFPEAWEVEAIEAEWIDVPEYIREAVKGVGYDPPEILKWGIKNEREEVVRWALENGADINKLDEETLVDLGSKFSVDFVRGIVENYVTDKEAKRFIYEGMLEGGIEDVDERKVETALENGADINELCVADLWSLGAEFPYDFVKRIEKKYVINESAKQIIYGELLWRAVEERDEDAIREILANKKIDVDIGRLEVRIWGTLAYEFPTDFLKEIVSDYDVEGEVKDILLGVVFRRGLEKEHREDVMWALENGVRVDEGDKKELDNLLGPNWEKYLARR